MNECTVELVCVYLPAGHSREDAEAALRTKAMWGRAKAVCDSFGVSCRSQEHEERGEVFGDAYLYPPLDMLADVLRGLDAAGVAYDDIDLPADAPPETVSRFRSMYPRDRGVRVNVKRR